MNRRVLLKLLPQTKDEYITLFLRTSFFYCHQHIFHTFMNNTIQRVRLSRVFQSNLGRSVIYLSCLLRVPTIKLLRFPSSSHEQIRAKYVATYTTYDIYGKKIYPNAVTFVHVQIENVHFEDCVVQYVSSCIQIGQTKKP